MKTRILISLISLIPICLQAQINLRPGYIITNTNDTIAGSIDFRTAERNVHQCTFIEQNSDETKVFMPGDIYGYRFTDDGKFYVTRTVTIDGVERKYFLEYIIQGIISLYYFPNNFPHYFFETADGKMVEVSKNDKWITTDNGLSGIRTDKRYIGVLNYIFAEDKDIQKKVPYTNIDTGSLARLTREYHYAVCTTGEECIEFESKPDRKYIKVSFSAYAAIKKYNLKFASRSEYINLDEMNSASPSLGVEIGFRMPRVSRALSVHLTVESSFFKGERIFDSNIYGYTKFQSEAFVLDNRFGVRIAPFTSKIQPYFEIGYCQSFLSGFYLKKINEEYHYEKNVIEKVSDFSKTPPKFYPGLYGGLGISYPIRNHSISFSVNYQSASNRENEFNAIGANLKFEF